MIVIVGVAIVMKESLDPIKLLGCSIGIGGVFLYSIIDKLVRQVSDGRFRLSTPRVAAETTEREGEGGGGFPPRLDKRTGMGNGCRVDTT